MPASSSAPGDCGAAACRVQRCLWWGSGPAPAWLMARSQNHRMFGVGRDLCGSPSPTPLPKQGPLQQAAQDLVQMGLEYLQRRRLHNLPGQPVPVLRHPHSEEVLPHVQTELPLLPFVPIAPCPVAGHHWKESGPVLLTPTLQIFIGICKRSPLSLLFWSIWVFLCSEINDANQTDTHTPPAPPQKKAQASLCGALAKGNQSQRPAGRRRRRASGPSERPRDTATAVSARPLHFLGLSGHYW